MDLRVMHPTRALAHPEVHSATKTRSRSLELGLGLIVIALPLSLLPASMAPFVDAKLVVLAAGTLLLWSGRGGESSSDGGANLTIAAALWAAAVVAAGLAGVDRWWSLLGPENIGNGLLLLGPAAALLVVATRVPDEVRARIPLWLVGTSAAVAVLGLASKIWPRLAVGDGIAMALDGSTLGHPVFVASFVAVGVVAAVGVPKLKPGWLVLLLVVLSSALAVSTKRVGWVALAVGLGMALWRARPPRKRVLLIVGTVAASLAAWTLVDTLLTPSASLSGARRFGELRVGSAHSRIGAWSVLGSAWANRPVLGWGPGNTWSAYVSSATPSQLGVERGYGDSHNILVEMAVTTGVIGLAAFLMLAGVVTKEMRRAGRSAGWALGAAAALFVHHLMQPMHVVLTPLLFLMAGLACRPGAAVDNERTHSAAVPLSHRFVRPLVAVLLAAGLLFAAGSLAGSVLERQGRTYASEWALRASLAVSPGRITAAQALATTLALDARSGDAAARREARELMARTVELHPWNPGVRLVAADVHTLMRDPAGAAVWTARHFARFPGDLPSLRSGGSSTEAAARP